ncbi:MAG: HAD family hydrolase [Rhodobacteraceae bacterium]|nr:HAD family hydrolase [Paracoccaceae bacterium]
MWSGPRNLSTALMYSFAARGDCGVWDEPFYAAYLARTGLAHPLRGAILGAHDADPARVARACAGPAPGGRPLFYQKQMTMHLLADFPRDFLAACTHVFLIRHPARVVASYVRKREAPTLADLGYAQQAALFDEVADRLGRVPPVIDSADIRADPAAALACLCAALAIPYTPRMLTWEAGPKPYDGVWAPHWYGAVHASTGFEAPEGPLPELEGAHARLAGAALPDYARLFALRLALPSPP